MTPSTSTQRTYRYVRLGILGAVLALAVALVAVFATEGPLTSISALHYTGGSGVFTGSLFAISFALVVLAGRSPSQALLDLAALLAPLIAILPTPVRTGDVPGLVVDCPGTCVPTDELPGIAVGLTAFAVVALVAVVAALVLARVQGTFGPGVVATAAAATAIVAGGALWWWVAPAGFLLGAHVVAATAFLVLIAVVAGLAARRSVPPYRVVYLSTAIAIVVDLVALLGVVVLRIVGVDLVADTGIPLVLVGEAIALALFAVFWTAQTVQDWDDLDPALRTAARAG